MKFKKIISVVLAFSILPFFSFSKAQLGPIKPPKLKTAYAIKLIGLKALPKINEPIYFTIMLNYEKRSFLPQQKPICLLSSPDSNNWFAFIGIQLSLFDQNGQIIPLRFDGYRRKPVVTPYYRDGIPVLAFQIWKSDLEGNFTEIQWFISEQPLKCQTYSARLKIYLYNNNNYNPDNECLTIDYQQNYLPKCD